MVRKCVVPVSLLPIVKSSQCFGLLALVLTEFCSCWSTFMAVDGIDIAAKILQPQ